MEISAFCPYCLNLMANCSKHLENPGIPAFCTKNIYQTISFQTGDQPPCYFTKEDLSFHIKKTVGSKLAYGYGVLLLQNENATSFSIQSPHASIHRDRDRNRDRDRDRDTDRDTVFHLGRPSSIGEHLSPTGGISD